MRRALALLIVVVTLFLLAACGGGAEPQEIAGDRATMSEAPMAPAAEPEMDAGAAGVIEPSQPQAVLDSRKIVYTTMMSMVVKDLAATMEQIQALAAGAQGYVSQSQLSQYTGDQLRGNITLRVPVESYGGVLAQLRAMAVRVLNESSDASDVTAEYTDLEAQLRNLEAAEKELQALLTEVRERPNATAEEILNVYNALSAKRGEIEQVKGRLQYLSNQVALSTITVDLVPDEITRPIVEDTWQPLVTVKAAFGTLINILQGLVDLVINLLVVVLPVLLIVALPIALLILLIRAWRKRRKAPVAGAQAGQ